MRTAKELHGGGIKQEDPYRVMPHYWHQLLHGMQFQQALRHHLDPWWRKILGTHLLKLGHLSADLDLTHCPMMHQSTFCFPAEPTSATAAAYALPYSDHFFDASLLVHTLSYVPCPYRVLGEISRVLAQDGWLIVNGFNPFSIIGIGKLLPVVRHRQPYCCQLVSCNRIADWLRTHNYTILSQQLFQISPWHHRLLCGLKLPLLGCQYLLIARKRTAPLTILPHIIHYQPDWVEPFTCLERVE